MNRFTLVVSVFFLLIQNPTHSFQPKKESCLLDHCSHEKKSIKKLKKEYKKEDADELPNKKNPKMKHNSGKILQRAPRPEKERPFFFSFLAGRKRHFPPRFGGKTIALRFPPVTCFAIPLDLAPFPLTLTPTPPAGKGTRANVPSTQRRVFELKLERDSRPDRARKGTAFR